VKCGSLSDGKLQSKLNIFLIKSAAALILLLIPSITEVIVDLMPFQILDTVLETALKAEEMVERIPAVAEEITPVIAPQTLLITSEIAPQTTEA
jgi:hypothetical protein